MENKYLCKYCSVYYSSDRATKFHEGFCKDNPNRKSSWNSGKTKESSEIIAKLGKSISIAKTGVSRNGWKPWNDGLIGTSGLTGKGKTEEIEKERCRKLSEWATLNGNGGYKPGSGRGKKGWYKGYFCDSSWELAFLIYHLDHNITIDRCKEIRYYTFNGRTKKYHPDFVVDGKIIEIKGFKTDEVEAKLQFNPDIIHYYKDDMKLYLDYAIYKYGKNFIYLYENKDN